MDGEQNKLEGGGDAIKPGEMPGVVDFGDWLSASAIARKVGRTPRMVRNYMAHVETRTVRGVGGDQLQARERDVRAYMAAQGLEAKGKATREPASGETKEEGAAGRKSEGGSRSGGERFARTMDAEALALPFDDAFAKRAGELANGDMTFELGRVRALLNQWLGEAESPANAFTTAQRQQMAGALRAILGEFRQLDKQRAEIQERRAQVMPVEEVVGMMEYLATYLSNELTGLAATVCGELGAGLARVEGVAAASVDPILRVVAVRVRESVDAIRTRFANEMETKAASAGKGTKEAAA